MIQKSPAIEKLLDRYLNLDIAGKKIRCPYWMNIIHPGLGHRKIFGPYGGKGKPHQIIQATLDTAKMDGIPLEGMSSWQVRKLMENNRIGIDCSGLAYWLLDALDRQKGGNGLEDDILGVKGRFLIRANVEMLTNDEVTMPIEKIAEVEIGDMIRLHGGKHLAVVIRIKKIREKVRELVYAHSTNFTWFKGIHTGRILVKDLGKDLSNQTWLEKTRKGENYGKKCFWPEKGDGIRRLKVWV